MPSVMSTQPSAGPCVLSPLPHAVSSSTVVTSQTQWYSPKGSNMVVFRSDRQVIVPQAGTTTVYRAGREIVMSSSGTESGSKSQKEESLASSSVTRISPKESWQPQDNLHDTNSPKITPASFLDVCNHSAVSSQPESCMTQSRDAGMSDGQRQRCTLLPNPAFTSNRDATTFEEGVVPFSTPQRDCSLHSKPVFQRNSNLFAESRSERGESMTDPGDSVANGPEQDNILSKREAVSLSGSQRLWCPLDAEEEISVSRKSSGSQEVGPQDQKLISQTELIKEQHSPRKDSLVFTPDSNVTLAETTNSSEEPPSHKNGNRNSKAEPEPEELVDMELFVDTLRNMEPAELRKPLKLLPRSTRPSTLAKHTVLPPIHEDHITPKSQVCLPAALGELFALTEEKNSEEREDLKKEDAGFSEEETEEIENPYGSMDEKIQEKEQDRKPYPWENKSFKTEEEIGSFLGKLQQGLGNQEVSVIAPKALANQTNLIRANILKGISLLSGLPDKKVVEDNKPYSRLDNSLLYSRFISPQSQSRETSKGKDVRCSIIFLNPGAPKGNKEHQTFPSGIHMSSESPPSGTQAEPFSRVPGASRSTKEMTVQSKGTVSPSRSAAQVSKSWLCSKIILYSESGFGGQKREIWGDIADATFWPLSHTISIRVIRGGWVMYEKPRFYGRKCVLAEGDVEITNPWRMYNKDGAEAEDAPFRIGSLKRVVRDYKIPEISLFSEENGEGTKQRFTDSSEDTRMYSQPLRAASIIVYSGLWLVYSKPFFDDDPYVLEPGGYPSLQAWGAKDPSVCSIHPIKLGCPVVEKPGEPKDFLNPALVLFEAMDFEEGPSIELSEALPDVELASYGTMTQSIHVLSGVWVAYEDKNFAGEQYILEKGVYRNCEDWGASNCQISSVQPILQVGEHSLHFISKIQLFSDPDFLGNYVSFEEDQALLPENFIPRSCRVNGGSWILYDGPQFDGEQHVLSEGEYPTLTSMGCLFTTAIRSLKKVPICFEGKEIELNAEVRSLQAEGFNNHVLSVRVKGGIWVLCEHSDFRGRQWLLDRMEITNWLTYSGLQHIGSLYPIRQKRIYFQIKNEELKSFLSVPDDVEDMKAGRVLVSELSDSSSSIWYYEDGLLKNQEAEPMTKIMPSFGIHLKKDPHRSGISRCSEDDKNGKVVLCSEPFMS
ncbi:hypothetical protein JD844_005405 [Phrynosoma platyrhinos]|uniref:Beta/gamma crystallin 'Greek key' domain-containing protein n=1 Tax=Phrynosoma platyrhinos TaxID=52577 RepID=A0ABQ7TPV1_PHRPL|nr:hypothetical protein JD844_005405 [Phrynosoma platyrhinos]